MTAVREDFNSGSMRRSSEQSPARYNPCQPTCQVARSPTGDGTRKLSKINSMGRRLPRFGRSCTDRKSTRLNASHANISYAVFCLKKKKQKTTSATHLYDAIRHTRGTTQDVYV